MQNKILSYNVHGGFCTPGLRAQYQKQIQDLEQALATEKQKNTLLVNSFQQTELRLTNELQAAQGTLFDTQIRLKTYVTLLDSIKKLFIEIEGSVQQIGASIAETATGTKESQSALAAIEQATIQLKDSTQTIDDATERLTSRAGEDTVATKSTLQKYADLDQQIATLNQDRELVLGLIKEVKKIVSSIGLLSMNMAIESAHAGAAGAGFMVVTEEVRQLHDKAGKTLLDAETKIKNMMGRMQQLKTSGELVRTALQASVTSIEATANDSVTIRTQTQALSRETEASSQGVVEFAATIEETASIINTISATMQRFEKTYSTYKYIVGLSAAVEGMVSAAGAEAKTVADVITAAGKRMISSSGKTIIFGTSILLVPFKDLPATLKSTLKESNPQAMYAVTFDTIAGDATLQVAVKDLSFKCKAYKLTEDLHQAEEIAPFIKAWVTSSGLALTDVLQSKANVTAMGVTAIENITVAGLQRKDLAVLDKLGIQSISLSGAVIHPELIYLSVAFLNVRRTIEEVRTMQVYPSLLRVELRKKDTLWPAVVR